MFDDQLYRRYTRVLSLGKGWEGIVNTSGADYFLWPWQKHKHIEALRASGEWSTLYTDRVAVLLVRALRPMPDPLVPSPDSAWREVALGWRAANAKDLPEAEKHLSWALELQPNLSMACEWLANIQARAERMDEAGATLDRCQRLFPVPGRRKRLMEHFRQRTETEP